ncbi:MAG: glycosyltransferase family 4 protein [Gemmatimonadales bacterium]
MGAPQVRLSSMARELALRGHDVRILTALPNYPTGRVFRGYRGRLWRREALDGVPVLRTWIYPSQSARLAPRLASYLSFSVTSLAAAPAVGRADFVFVESPPLFLGVSGRILARVTAARWMLNVADLWPDSVVELGMVRDGRGLRLARWLERSLYQSADFVVAATEGIRNTLRTVKAVPDRKLLFLPNGVDIELFRPRPPDQRLAAEYALDGKAVFVFAGTHGHAQDLPTIVQAAALLRGRRDIAIVFVGDGPVKRWAEEEAARRDLAGVRFIDPQPLARMGAWWSIARGALVTLRDLPLFEGARPSKSLPALASGVPIIYAGRGEWAAILAGARAGLVVEPGSPQGLADAITRLVDDPQLAAEIGRNGRQLAEQRFSWQAIVGDWLEELESKLSPAEAR